MPPLHDFYPQPCPWPLIAGGSAWRVPYRRVKGFHNAFEAVINLDLRECGGRCAYPQTVSFVIDTGTDVTLVPRCALDKNSFVAPLSTRVHRTVHGLLPGSVAGKSFQAILSIPNVCGIKPFDFGKMEVVIVDPWHHPHGMLGLNALRRVLMLSSHSHVYLQAALIP